MSFRHISALPTCVHGRLATRQTNVLFSVVRCYKCSSTLAQATTTENREHYSLVTTTEAINLRGTHRRGHQARKEEPKAYHETITHRVLPKKFPNSSNNRIGSNSDSTARNRVGKALEIPGFISNTINTQDLPAEECDRTPKLREPGSEGHTGRYEEWEDLHDKFLHIRRTRPAEMLEVFQEQRRLASRFLGNITQTEVSSLEFRCKWFALNTTEQSKILPGLLVGSLAESAGQALFVLANIGNIPYSYRIRMNCLRSIGIMYWKKLQQDPELRELYEMLIEKLRSPESWPKRKLPTVLLQNLLFWSTPEQCQQIIRDFSMKYPDADPSSTVAIIDHYIRIEDREQAFEYFTRLPEKSLHEPDVIITGLRDRLLKLDFVAESDTGTNFKYLPKLLALGIPSDEALHNMVIESAISNKIPDVAWDVYQYLESSKFRSSARSHLVLLRDSFSRGDLQRVNQLMTAMHHREDLISDQYLMAYAMNIVRNISCYEKNLGPVEAQRHIMALYDRAFHRAPLTTLGVAQPVASDLDLQQPSPTLLAFTLWTYILVQRRDSVVLSLWAWMKHLIARDDKAIVDAAKFDVIYNGLILFHARRSTSLSRALDVMQYMLSGGLCLPTPRTWSILVCAFLRHGQAEQAKRVLALMQSRGYKVQVITEKYGEYIPPGHDLESMAKNLGMSLDASERGMPEGMEEMMAGSILPQPGKGIPDNGGIESGVF